MNVLSGLGSVSFVAAKTGVTNAVNSNKTAMHDVSLNPCFLWIVLGVRKPLSRRVCDIDINVGFIGFILLTYLHYL